MVLTPEQKQALHPINIIVFFLSLYVIGAVVADTFFTLSPEVHNLLRDVDYAICIVFFIDFWYRLFTAKNKWRYMRWGWLDLLSSIPVNLFLAGRLFRIFQLLRVLRAIRSVRLVAGYFLKNRIKGAFVSAALLAFAMLVFCALAILKMEKDVPNSNIKTAEDALWWAYVTITTVGYGDKYPVTPEGRVIATALMTVGVGLFGIFTAYLASWFVAKKEEEEESEEHQRQAEKHKRERPATPTEVSAFGEPKVIEKREH